MLLTNEMSKIEVEALQWFSQKQKDNYEDILFEIIKNLKYVLNRDDTFDEFTPGNLQILFEYCTNIMKCITSINDEDANLHQIERFLECLEYMEEEEKKKEEKPSTEKEKQKKKRN